jgi:molybdopterin-containing oxidoreductase family iron-sulfur binding subunit
VRKIKRREFLKVAAGGTGAFMAVGFGVKSTDDLIPYITPPKHIVPGTVTLFATTCRECPAGCGLHAWNRDGRVTKVEGNPNHPINRGGLCARGQSAVQGLYDPDRVRGPMRRAKDGAAQPVEWKDVLAEIADRLRTVRQAGGESGEPGHVAVLSDLQSGSMGELQAAFAVAFSGPAVCTYEPFNYEPLRVAHKAIYGAPLIPDYRIDRSDFVLSFGVDFLETWLSPVQFAHRFVEMRTPQGGRMGRFVYAGPRLSMTAANADEFIQLAPGAERWLALAMLKVIVEKGWARQGGDLLKAMVAALPADLAAVAGAPAKWGETLAKSFGARAGLAAAAGVPAERIEALAKSFAEARAGLALACPTGASGPAAEETAIAAALLNYVVGRPDGQVIDFSRRHALGETATQHEVDAFFRRLTPQDVLIVHNANPVHTCPGAAEAIRRVGTVVYLGTMMNETAELATHVLPIDSPLESWGDYRPASGGFCLLQPTMGRVFDTRSAGDVLMDLMRLAGVAPEATAREKPAADFREYVRQRWKFVEGSSSAASGFWSKALRDGTVWEDLPPRGPPGPLKINDLVFSFSAKAGAESADAAADLWLWPSVMLFDGRTANRGWLQEAPDPTSHVTWGSWIDIHPTRAKALGIADGDVIELSSKAGKVEVPARLTEDIHESAVSLAFGQGHTALGRNAKGRGANAFQLLGGEGPGFAVAGQGPFGQVTIRKTGGRAAPVLATSGEQRQFGREIVQWLPMDKLRTMKPGDGTPLILPLPEGYRPDKDIYPPRPYKDHRWAMVVDLARCIGCGACAVACYAENNLPVVGSERVERGHHLPWLQVVPYRHPEEPGRLAFLPIMCQHCDAAPCEPVCPVFASVHNEEGLNAQVYNRCIGTRYCSNNCPYKVRRFNWVNIAWEKPLDWQLNPEVTVRVRGVMEKCTFCIQRIRAAEDKAGRQGRKVRDGEVQPACVQSCPTRAYTFGDLLDAESQVTKLTRLDPRRYHVLETLNTKPAVAYLRRVFHT